ncbi:hypothetical protein PGT21_020149 [Puccinia graminis f. sp. tritici]|uniref:Uncharacterized protein n=1 Tax=Puccinia graminis f. sp. tritici TaxID=56615 RepID=A0A5B0PU79_PUCGR|nr:hypothetical protein PGT21_020149 [Puccinia graminis f. sp. tritici]
MNRRLGGLDEGRIGWMLRVRRLSSSSGRIGSSDLSRKYSHQQPTSSYDHQFFGQPLPITHPHLLAPHELTIGIPREEYAQRRAKLMDLLPDGSSVIIAGARTKWMAHHVL